MTDGYTAKSEVPSPVLGPIRTAVRLNGPLKYGIRPIPWRAEATMRQVGIPTKKVRLEPSKTWQILIGIDAAAAVRHFDKKRCDLVENP